MSISDWSSDVCSSDLANTLGIPVVAILDSNVDPSGIAFPVPANDDASRAIRLYCDAVAAAATKGGQGAAVAAGYDLGSMAEPPAEEALAAERSEEHTSELQSLMRISYAVFCLKKKINHIQRHNNLMNLITTQSHT